MSASVAETCKMSLPAGESSGTLSLYRDWEIDGAKRGKWNRKVNSRRYTNHVKQYTHKTETKC